MIENTTLCDALKVANRGCVPCSGGSVDVLKNIELLLAGSIYL